MTIDEIAADIAQLNRTLRFAEAGEKYWASDVVSLEPPGQPMAVCKGIKAVREKGAWFSSVSQVHAMEVEGPFMHGDQFALRFVMDFTRTDTGERMTMTEVGLFTVRGGKVIEERYFY